MLRAAGYIPGVLTKGLTERAPREHSTALPGLSRLDRPTGVFGTRREALTRDLNGADWSSARRSGFVGRRHCRGQEQAVGRRCRRRIGHAEEGWHYLQGPLPVPR